MFLILLCCLIVLSTIGIGYYYYIHNYRQQHFAESFIEQLEFKGVELVDSDFFRPEENKEFRDVYKDFVFSDVQIKSIDFLGNDKMMVQAYANVKNTKNETINLTLGGLKKIGFIAIKESNGWKIHSFAWPI